MMHRRLLTALAAAAAFAPAVAMAHPGMPGHTHGFTDGFAHPFGGLDHLAAMTAVGLWAGQQAKGGHGSRAVWLGPLAFLALLVAGAIAGANGLALPGVEWGIVLSVAALGWLTAFGARLPLAAGVALIGAFALCHGAAHGVEMPADADGLAYGLGFVTASAVLHLTGVALSRLAERAGLQLVPRLAGLGLAAMAPLLLAV
ncbi:HupE/UreJ family protein [Nitrospirillum viridazoti]|uniref:Urease accessory protein n=1 Tax=Nitrospirillum viridazoti CBAmc TaxID=1441467 RepID=A0A248JYF2_9PROT|nr:HupE/UreJ family protein [Nitrospirillum amazonense]ASG23745.1 urease accessory protein [Nitrospirillum amazonense CBAmc]